MDQASAAGDARSGATTGPNRHVPDGLRVVIVNDASLARGGATGLALFQAELLRARGIEVVFFAADREVNPNLTAQGATHINAGSDPLMKAPRLKAATRGLYNRDVARQLAAFIAETDTPRTVYHTHSWSKTLTPAVFSALTPVAPRVFLHAHDFFFACPNGGYMNYQRMDPCTLTPLSATCLATHCDKRSRAQKGWRVVRQAILHRALPRQAPWGGILMIHPGMAPFLELGGHPLSRLHTVRNPATALSSNRVRAEDNTGFLFIGRVEAEKGIEDLIAAAQLAQVALTVVGEGPLREPLAAAHPDIRFTGWMDRAGMAVEVAQARALVMPSRYPEPFGLVAAEASLSGLPVILAETALLGAEFAAGGLGWTVDIHDRAAFSSRLRAVAHAPAHSIAEMSHRAAARTVEICSTPDSWIEAQLSHYARALA